MKNNLIVSLAALVPFVALAFIGSCTSLPVDPTPRQQVVAEAVEDAISIGLVPVLTRNPAYLADAQRVAALLGTLAGATLAPADVDAFLARTALTAEDARIVAGVVNAAWAVYQRRYAAQVSTSLRPDVKLFLAAVANGINAAVAAVPRSAPGTPIMLMPEQWQPKGRASLASTRDSFDGRCPECKASGLTSTVEIGAQYSTLAAPIDYYDKEGVYHASRDTNVHTTEYHCSRGHSFQRKN